MNLVKKALKAREATSLLFLVALFVIVSLINPSFASSENIAAVFNSSVVYILIAVGMAFAIIVGEIDVSVGSCLGFVATVVGSMLRDGHNWLLAFVVGILIGIVIGFINGWGVAVMGVPSLIFTLGVNGVLRGAMYIYSGGAWVENLPKAFKDFSSATLLGKLTVYCCCAFLLVIAIHLLLTRTRKGRYFTAVGDNAGGAMLVGISPVRTKVTADVICDSRNHLLQQDRVCHLDKRQRLRDESGCGLCSGRHQFDWRCRQCAGRGDRRGHYEFDQLSACFYGLFFQLRQCDHRCYPDFNCCI